MTCDKCPKSATVNYQSGEMRWTIEQDGHYHGDARDFVADDGENAHWCNEHDPYNN